MLKLLVVRFWPVLLPILIYLLWLVLARRKAHKKGDPLPTFFDGPWIWTVVATLALAIGGFVFLGALSTKDNSTEGRYVPAKVIDGKIIPGHKEPE